MTSAYTCVVQNGTVTDLSGFALRCARAFGALVPMRDEPMDAPLPEKLEPSVSHHDERIEKYQNILKAIDLLSEEDCQSKADSSYEVEIEYYKKRLQERDDEIQRCEKMLVKVRAWRVPEELLTLKTFMMTQLSQAIGFLRYEIENPIHKSGETWRKEEKREARMKVNYHMREKQDEIDRTAKRQEWLDMLRSALKKEETL